jgi:hypothetical protein
LLPGRATPLRITATLASWPAGLRALALVPPSPHWAPPPRIPAGDHGTLYYACTDPGFAVAARHRWAGRMLTLSPPLSGTPAAMAMTPAAVPGPAGGTAVLEVAGCVGRPVWSGP